MLNVRKIISGNITSVLLFVHILTASQIYCCKVTIFADFCDDFEQVLFSEKLFCTKTSLQMSLQKTCSKSVK